MTNTPNEHASSRAVAHVFYMITYEHLYRILPSVRHRRITNFLFFRLGNVMI